MIKQTKENRELSEMVADLSEGITSQLKELLPNIDLRPVLSSRKIKQALLDITPEEMQRLYGEFGIAEVSQWVSEFMEGREW